MEVQRPSLVSLSERRQTAVSITASYSKSISTTGGQWKHHFQRTVTQTPSTLKMKMSIWGGIERWEMRWWKKGRERWSNAEALRTWEEVVTWLGEKIRLILFESRYQLSERLFGRAGEMMAWEGSEIVGGWLRSLWASAWMKQPVMVLTPLKSFHKYA